jgi:hypothetical protein
MPWIEKLFERFSAMYGSRFADLWASADPEQVKRVWAEGLAAVTGEQVQAALRSCLTEYPTAPTLPQFAILCRAHRKPLDVPRLVQASPPDPRVAAEVHELAMHMKDNKRDSKNWARRILKRVELGHKVPAISVDFAKEALGLGPKEAA